MFYANTNCFNVGESEQVLTAPLKPFARITTCLGCEKQEEIPYKVVRDLDEQDFGDPSVLPQFSCEDCDAAMYLRYYKGVYGFEDRLLDLLDTQGP